ncbi:hypothetical protein VTN49DRAFT_6355 [Thermomyces lanuginosus]
MYSPALVGAHPCVGPPRLRGVVKFRVRAVASLLRYMARRPIRIQLLRAGAKSPRSGTDSDLEAFSHYPTDDSVAALPGQAAAKTNYLIQRFLSY